MALWQPMCSVEPDALTHEARSEQLDIADMHADVSVLSR
jgi:hypothetical protein